MGYTIYGLATAVSRFNGNRATAIEYADRALRLSPFDPWAYEAHVAHGIVAVHESRYDEAAWHLAKAIAANPSFTSPRFLHAMVLALAGREDEAREAAREALALQPGFRLRLLSEIGMLPAIADVLARGGRLLGLPE